METKCFVCQAPAAVEPRPKADSDIVDCRRCGRFEISRRAEVALRRAPEQERAKISGWIFDQNELGDHPRLLESTLDLILAQPDLSLLQKSDRLLLALAKRTKRPGDVVRIDDPSLVAAIHASEQSDVTWLASRMLAQRHWVELAPDSRSVEVLPDGLVRAEEILNTRPKSAQCFVAMWFASSMREIYENGFARAIQGAGYTAVRVDSIEHTHRIDDEIIAQIRRSGLVVADFTGHRGGVYFEAGFAMGLGIPVFWTCQGDDLGALHFDIRQFNFIAWKDVEDLRDRLQKRIEAVLGDGPGKNRI